MIFSPVVTVSVSTIVLMLLLGISYDTYHKYTQGIVFLLTPVTVAFAIPIYENREVIRRQLPILSIAILVGMFVGVASAFLMGNMFHFDSEVTNSLMARSISTPFAVVLASEIHGSASLVSLFTIITGFVGMIFGDLFLAFTRIRFHTANGVALGKRRPRLRHFPRRTTPRNRRRDGEPDHDFGGACLWSSSGRAWCIGGLADGLNGSFIVD